MYMQLFWVRGIQIFNIHSYTLCVTPVTYSVNLSLQKEECAFRGMERNVSFTWYFKSIGPAARTRVFHEAGFVTIH